MLSPTDISSILAEATTYGLAKLCVKEHGFVRSVYAQSQLTSFSGLSVKQNNNWLSAIKQKLMKTKGKHQWEVVAERARPRLQRYHNAYWAACW